MFEPVDGRVGAGIAEARVEVAAQGLDEHVADQGTLARTRHPGDAYEHAQGNRDVAALEVVVGRPAHDQAFFAGRAAPGGNRDPPRSRKILPGHALRLGGDGFGRAGGHDRPAAHSGPGAEIDHVVGRPDRLFVVLDHDHGVALVAQVGQRRQQPIVVAGMEPDRRLVEDVQHADQPAADLPGQPDPLHLAAGQRGGRAIQREIVETHVAQKLQAPANLLQRLGRDRLSRGVEIQGTEELGRLGNRQGAHLGQGALGPVGVPRRGRGQGDRSGLGMEPLAAARRAADHAHVFFQRAPLHPALGAAILRQEPGDDSLVGAAPFVS